jgi:hypothetical protein
LWRVAAYSAPGFASPTISLIVTFIPDQVNIWRVVYVVRRVMTKFSGRNGENGNDYHLNH